MPQSLTHDNQPLQGRQNLGAGFPLVDEHRLLRRYYQHERLAQELTDSCLGRPEAALGACRHERSCITYASPVPYPLAAWLWPMPDLRRSARRCRHPLRCPVPGHSRTGGGPPLGNLVASAQSHAQASGLYLSGDRSLSPWIAHYRQSAVHVHSVGVIVKGTGYRIDRFPNTV